MTILHMDGFRMGRNTGKSLLSEDLMKLVCDFDGDSQRMKQVPTFTWTERYTLTPETRRYFNRSWGLFKAYMGETNPRSFLPQITRVEIGNGFGHELRRRARILEPWDPKTTRPPRRFWVPAYRWAGFRAYPDLTVTYLDRPRAYDYSRYAFDSHLYNYRVRWEGGMVFVMPKDTVGYGTYTITYPADFEGWTTRHSPRTLRASERRARYSSTMDGNGKPKSRKR